MMTVVGSVVFAAPGEEIEAEGAWVEHSEYGERFDATRIQTKLPVKASAAQKYLGSGLVRGIGPELAQRMVGHFGADIFDVLDHAPELLRDVEGIGPKRVESLRLAWREQQALRGLMEFLGTHGLNASKAPRILRAVGPDAVDVLSKNPYRLARDVPGVGFKSADLIARHLGLDPASEERLASALHDRLQSAISRGHCAYPVDELFRDSAGLLEVPTESNEAALRSALDGEIEAGRLDEVEIPSDGGRLCVAPPSLMAAEARVARDLRSRASRSPAWGSTVFLSSPPQANRKGSALQIPSLSDPQKNALTRLLSANVSVLTGGPGTGKTTLIRAVDRTLSARGYRVVTCAPTGRASQRLFEAAGVEAQTIHRLLGWDPREHAFRHGPKYPLRADLVVVDEASMIGVELMDSLLSALAPETGVLLIGDTDQLPSVQAGRVLASLLESRWFAHVALREVFRQSRGSASGILSAARNVLDGKLPPLASRTPEQDFHFIDARDPERVTERVLELVGNRIPARFGLDPLKDIQVICPMNKGLVGARQLNRRLQAHLRRITAPAGGSATLESIERFGTTFASGDKVIVTANDYDKDVFNGDIGRILQIERERSSLRIGFADKRVDFSFTELDDIALAYAITIHKSQGSEYEAVVVPLLEEAGPMLSRRLLYTAITRGRRLVVVVGSPRALQLAVRVLPGLEHRWSTLAQRLVEGRVSLEPI